MTSMIFLKKHVEIGFSLKCNLFFVFFLNRFVLITMLSVLQYDTFCLRSLLGEAYFTFNEKPREIWA